MARILMLLGHDYSRPSFDPRVQKEARSLLDHGHEVFVLCFSEDEDATTEDGVRVLRIKRSKNVKKQAKRSPMRALAGLAVDLPVTMRRGFRVARRVKADVIHAHDVDTLPLGVLLKAATGRALVYDSHELATGLQLAAPILMGIAMVERVALPRVDLLITANESRLSLMRKRYGHRIRNALVLENFPIRLGRQSIPKVEVDPALLSGRRVFIYQGPLDPNRGVLNLVEAFATLDRDGWTLLLVGGKADEVRQLKARYPSPNILATGQVKNDHVAAYMQLSHIGVLALQNTCLNNYFAAPNKLYEYMQSGCALMAPAFADFEQLVRQGKLGDVADFGDVADLQRCIRGFLEVDAKTLADYRERSKEAGARYVWESQEAAFESAYAGLGRPA